MQISGSRLFAADFGCRILLYMFPYLLWLLLVWGAGVHHVQIPVGSDARWIFNLDTLIETI
jgi:hypothetical protein